MNLYVVMKSENGRMEKAMVEYRRMADKRRFSAESESKPSPIFTLSFSLASTNGLNFSCICCRIIHVLLFYPSPVYKSTFSASFDYMQA